MTSDPASQVALRLVVFDCSLITWNGIRMVMNRNTESMRKQPERPGVVMLKCFYEYQKAMDEHMRLVLLGQLDKADMLESGWADYMMSVDEAGRRRARRRRGMVGWDENGRRRGGSSVCAVM